MLIDPVFLAAVCLATHPLDHQVRVEGLTTSSRRVLKTPSAIAKLAGPKLAITDQIIWAAATDQADQGYHGTASITVEGLPAKLVGTVRLASGGRGAVLEYRGELSVDVPLIGPSLAKQAAPQLLEALELQQMVGDEYLSQRHPAL